VIEEQVLELFLRERSACDGVALVGFAWQWAQIVSVHTIRSPLVSAARDGARTASMVTALQAALPWEDKGSKPHAARGGRAMKLSACGWARVA
jgi:hypothetical protein